MLEKKKLAGEGRTRRQDSTFTEAKVRTTKDVAA